MEGEWSHDCCGDERPCDWEDRGTMRLNSTLGQLVRRSNTAVDHLSRSVADRPRWSVTTSSRTCSSCKYSQLH